MQQYVQQIRQTLQGLDQDKLARWVSIGLVVGLAYTASLTTWRLVSVFHQPAAVRIPATIVAHNAPVHDLESSSLSRLHLFGSSEQASGTTVNAPDTRLNLSLNGVIASTDPRIARAFIAAAGGQESAYRLGASLPGGAILKEIHPDRVILLRNGRFETLRMPKKVDSIVLQEDTPAAAVVPANSIQPHVSREEIQSYKHKLLTEPRQLAGAIRQRPVRRDGKIIGYRLFPGKDRKTFMQLGLKPGDIITGVNGMPLSDPSSAMAIYGQLPQMSQLNIQLQRGGQSMSLVIPWQ